MTAKPLTPPDISIKALLELAGPIFIANIAIIGSGTIDTIMAGRLGKDHLAAITLGISATICVLMGLAGVLQGLSPIAGHHFGAKRYRHIGQEVIQSFWLGIALLCIGLPILLASHIWVDLAGVDGDVARMADQFMFWTAMALPASLAGRIFISVNAAVSRPRITMWVSLGMLALKAPLNAVFMYGWLGFPAMGGGGAGISFFVLSWLSLGAYAFIWKLDPYYRKMHAEKLSGPKWSLLKEHLHVGLPIGLSTFFEVSSFTFMAIFVSRFGSETASAHQIVGNMTSMCYMIPLSLGIASSVLVSQCLGARWPALGYAVLKRSLSIATATALMISILLFFTREPITSLYTKESGVHALASSLILFGCFYHLFDALQCVSSFSLRGYRVTRIPMLIYGIMLWGVGLGLGYYFAFHGEWAGGPYGVHGFWGLTAIGLFLTGSTLCAMALWVAKQFAKDDEHTPAEIAAALTSRT